VNVKWLKIIAMSGLLGLWLGATNHCSLEEIPGLNFLMCCDHGDTAPHQDNDCETDDCAVVEDGLYKTEDSRVIAAAPLLVLPVCLLPSEAELAATRAVLSDFLTISPPELPTTWQFSFRTALPVRAPSVTS
jgi:hypothetical protein